MKACLALLVIVFVGLSDACSQCTTKHPQQHYCDAHFAMQVKIIKEVENSDIENTKLYKAKILSSWKKGPQDGKFKFYTPDVFCGTSFRERSVYVITGSQEDRGNGKHYLLHGACDYVSEWQDMSSQQKMGFRQQYKESCVACTIASRRTPSDLTAGEINNKFAGAATYWTPTDCYYNPHKSQQFMQRPGSEVEDCEDEYGLCVPTGSDGGECQWKKTSDYKSCFKYRDGFALVDSGNFAITDEAQCDFHKNRRKRQKCRKTARRDQELRGANSRVASL